MAELVDHGYYPVMERRLFSLELTSPRDLPRAMDVGSLHFGCLIGFDAREASTADVCALVEPLIERGAVYFCAWGPDCERVHDIIDECDPYGDKGTVIVTTWHSRESLEDALLFFLNSMWPDECFEETFHAGLAISVGCAPWAETMRAALHDPNTFSRMILARSGDDSNGTT